MSLGASFTNSLHQRKPYFGIKIVPSGFTKRRRHKLVLRLVLVNMYLLVFPLKMQNISIKMNHTTRFTNVCARQITEICIINTPNKAHLKLFWAWNGCNYCC